MFAAEIDFFSPIFGMMGAILADVHVADWVFQDVSLCRFIQMRCLIMVMMPVLLTHVLFSFHGDFSDHPSVFARSLSAVDRFCFLSSSFSREHVQAWTVPDPDLPVYEIAGLNAGNILPKGFRYIGGPRKHVLDFFN
jgi:hypothetical protein